MLVSQHNKTSVLNTYRVALDRLCLHTGLDSMGTVQLLDKIFCSTAFGNRECKTSFHVPNAPLPYLLAHKSQNHSLYRSGKCHKLISQNIKPHQDGGQLCSNLKPLPPNPLASKVFISPPRRAWPSLVTSVQFKVWFTWSYLYTKQVQQQKFLRFQLFFISPSRKSAQFNACTEDHNS